MNNVSKHSLPMRWVAMHLGHPFALNDSAAIKVYARMGDSLPYLALLNGNALPLNSSLA